MYKATLLKLADLDKRDAEAAKVRARIRWAEEGEMSTSFFLRLEKRNGSTNWFSAIRNDDDVVGMAPLTGSLPFEMMTMLNLSGLDVFLFPFIYKRGS